jgi:hypothetical protein
LQLLPGFSGRAQSRRSVCKETFNNVPLNNVPSFATHANQQVSHQPIHLSRRFLLGNVYPDSVHLDESVLDALDFG